MSSRGIRNTDSLRSHLEPKPTVWLWVGLVVRGGVSAAIFAVSPNLVRGDAIHFGITTTAILVSGDVFEISQGLLRWREIYEILFP